LGPQDRARAFENGETASYLRYDIVADQEDTADMLDPKKLLAQFLGSRTGSSSTGGSGDILSQLGNLAGGLGGGGQGGLGGLKDVATRAGGFAQNNPMATSAVLAALLGSKTGRKLGGQALQYGGLAAVAGLGYLAYKNYQAGQQPTTVAQSPTPLALPPAGSGFDTDPQQTSDDFSLALVRAMIAAAKSDGHIDDAERRAILGKLSEDGLSAEEQAFLERELAGPVNLDSIVAAARTDEQKVEIYTASRLAIDPDTRAERGYLDQLAGRLGLPDALIDHIEATVSSVKTA
jgi:uncharacterized membrane protein YebE (DUF533 family)